MFIISTTGNSGRCDVARLLQVDKLVFLLLCEELRHAPSCAPWTLKIAFWVLVVVLVTVMFIVNDLCGSLWNDNEMKMK